MTWSTASLWRVIVKYPDYRDTDGCNLGEETSEQGTLAFRRGGWGGGCGSMLLHILSLSLISLRNRTWALLISMWHSMPS